MQLPTALSVSVGAAVVPDTAQFPAGVAVNVTVRPVGVVPDNDVAVSVTGDWSSVLSPIGGKLIVCDPLPMLIVAAGEVAGA